jgi:hypothetical protein
MPDTSVSDMNRVSFQGWLPAQEAADHLGVSREYIYRLKSIYDNGGSGIPGFMLGEKSSVLMFRVTDLDAYKRTHPDLGKNRAETGQPASEDQKEPAALTASA